MLASKRSDYDDDVLEFLKQRSTSDRDSQTSSTPDGEDFSATLNEASRRARAEGSFRRQPNDPVSFSDEEISHRSSYSEPALRSTEDGPLWRRDSEPHLPNTQPYSVRPHVFQDGPHKPTLIPPIWTVDQATRPLLLTFDAFGTLFAPKDPIEQQYGEVAAQYGLNIPSADILPSFKSAFKQLNKSHPNYGKATNTPFHVWWSHIIRDTLQPLLPQDTVLPPELIRELYERFASSAAYDLFDDVLPFLTTIGTSWSAATWPPTRTMLGIVSNSDPRVRSILSSFDIPILPSLFPPRYSPHSRRFHVDFGPATFAFATLSYETGYAKPDKKIYSAAVCDAQATIQQMAYVSRLTRTGLHLLDEVRDQFHCMHVGDELEKDVLPAIEAGWDGVLLDRDMKEEVELRTVGIGSTRLSEEQTVEVPVINSLSGLRQLVTRERFEDGRRQPKQMPVYRDETGNAADVLPTRNGRSRRSLRGRTVVPHPMSTRDNRLYMLK